MKSQEKIDYIIKNSAKFISSNLYCNEDKIFHRGRNSYLWTILLYLHTKEKNSKIINQVQKSLENYKDCFSKNATKDLILMPGLKDRGNYSTNAIDCGIFLDSIHDAEKMVQIGSYLKKSSYEIFYNYAFKKLVNRTPIHNQYLWLLTGFSRSISYFCSEEEQEVYKKFVIEIIRSFYDENTEDGFCVYSSLSSDLNHITTYYHSRCLAFVSYCLDNISYSNEKLEENFYNGALFLAKMFKKDGIKSLSLESKRYYFNNNYELASTPYDLYVFEKAYYFSKEEIWLQLASKSLDKFYETHNKNDLELVYENQKNFDWQCNIMRYSHIAWLTRLSNNFSIDIDNYRSRKKNNKIEFNIPSFISSQQKNSKSFLLVKGNQINTYQFLVTKSPISSLYGHRTIGLQPTKHLPISNLLIMFPYEYRCISLGLISLKSMKKDFESLKGTFLQIKDSIIRKNNFKKAFGIIKFHLFSYLLVRYTILSSSFPLILNNFEDFSNSIYHDIDIADLKGLNKINIGFRKIFFKNGNLSINDIISSKKFLFLMIPNTSKYNIKSNSSFRLSFKNFYIILIFGPFEITYFEN